MFESRDVDPQDLSRRQLMAAVAKYSLGVSILPWAALAGRNVQAQTGKGSKATRLIYLFMTGAMSHLDTFDPKTKADVRGQTSAIQTRISGARFGQFLPELAKQADKLAVVRSLNTTTGAHAPAQYLMRTSYRELATTRHPGIGSWMHKKLGRLNQELPVAVQVGGGVGPGYLGAEFAPVPIGDPSKGIENTKSPAYLTEKAFDKRMNLSRVFDTDFRKKAEKNSNVTGYDDLYEDAIGLLRSKDLSAFDINQEPEAQRTAYGDSRFGRGCLLARRLVENGVRYVEVTLGSWDHHTDLWTRITETAGDLDTALGALLSDLQSRGLLDETLVVIGSEFGRKPHPNQNAGRDHHPAAFSGVLAGGGIRGGQIYGGTDEDGFYAEDNAASVEDFNATIATAVGIPHNEEIFSPDGRPFTLGNGGTPLKGLL